MSVPIEKVKDFLVKHGLVPVGDKKRWGYWTFVDPRAQKPPIVFEVDENDEVDDDTWKGIQNGFDY